MQETRGAQQTWILQSKIQNEWIPKNPHKNKDISTISLNGVPL